MNVTMTAVLTVICASVCIAAAVYIAITQDLLRSSVAFFIELTGVSGVLLSLHADYLAAMIFVVAIFSITLVLTFTSVTMAKLNTFLKKEELKNKRKLIGFLCFGIGTGITGALGWIFISAPFLTSQSPRFLNGQLSADTQILGSSLLGAQVPIFVLLSILLLIILLGTGLLLRTTEKD